MAVRLLLVIPVEELEAQIIGWLKEGRDDAKDIVDLPWTVTRTGAGHYLAEHPKMPFVLNLVFGEGFVYLLVPLGFETLTLSNDERLKVYHTLLRLNEGINLLKFTLSGMNDEIVLRVDLDRKTLGKGEFNDALTVLLIGINEVVQALGLEEDFAQSIFEHVINMVLERIENGATEGELMAFLTGKVGMSREDAKTLLDRIFEAVKARKADEQDIGYF